MSTSTMPSPVRTRTPGRHDVVSVSMDDLTELEKISKRIAKREQENEADRLVRDRLIAEARVDGYQWPRLADAARLGRQGVEAAGRRGNGGQLPKPRQQK